MCTVSVGIYKHASPLYSDIISLVPLLNKLLKAVTNLANIEEVTFWNFGRGIEWRNGVFVLFHLSGD